MHKDSAFWRRVRTTGERYFAQPTDLELWEAELGGES